MSSSLSNDLNVSSDLALQSQQSAIKAVGIAPKGITTTEQIAVSSSQAPLPVVTEERAIGQATVDTKFLSALQPNVAPIQQAFDKVSAAEAEKASQEAAAQAALQQAGLLMAQAKQKDEELAAARLSAQQQLVGSQAGLIQQFHEAKIEREAMSVHDKLGAEIEARGAAKAKAEEAATAEAARIAAMEAAEAEAMMKVASAKHDQALAAMQELSGKRLVSQEESALATQRAATLTAKSEAHAREAKITEEQAAKTAASLAQLQSTLAVAPKPSALADGGVAAAFVPVPGIESKTIATEAVKEHIPVAKPVEQPICCTVPGVSTWNLMQTFTRASATPSEGNFPYVLHIRLLNANIGGASLPSSLLLRVRIGGVESRSDKILDGRPGAVWNLEGSLPVRDINDLVQISLVDGTGFTNLWSFDWERARILGSVFVKINTLVDGHQSRDNKLRLDGVGGIITGMMHLEKWQSQLKSDSSHARTGTGISDFAPGHGGYGGYGWKRRSSDASSDNWLLSRQSLVGSTGASNAGLLDPADPAPPAAVGLRT